MNFERFRYPSYDEPLLAAYAALFEAAFVVLHPFRPNLESSCGTTLNWAFVSQQTQIGSIPALNRALLTLIGAIRSELANPSASKVLQSFLDANGLLEPTNGMFDSNVLASISSVLHALGLNEFISVPELVAESTPIRSDNLLQNDGILNQAGSLVASDQSLVITVDWDSFFTVIYSSQEMIDLLTADKRIEGFAATSETRHFWFERTL